MNSSKVVILTKDRKVVEEFPGKTFQDVTSTPEIKKYASKIVSVELDKSAGKVNLVLGE